MKKSLLLLIPGLVAVGGCATPIGDVAPTHTVEVAFQARNVYSGYAARVSIQKDAGQGSTTVYTRNDIQGYGNITHDEKPVKVGTTFTASVSFYPLSGKVGTLPATTTLRATILVDGVEKNTVLISGATLPTVTGSRAASIATTL